MSCQKGRQRGPVSAPRERENLEENQSGEDWPESAHQGEIQDTRARHTRREKEVISFFNFFFFFLVVVLTVVYTPVNLFFIRYKKSIIYKYL